jgi:hypothetical protein
MDLSPEHVAEIESALRQLEEVDPADLPDLATELADLLHRILDGLERD